MDDSVVPFASCRSVSQEDSYYNAFHTKLSLVSPIIDRLEGMNTPWESSTDASVPSIRRLLHDIAILTTMLLM
jgi:hypothetical protein